LCPPSFIIQKCKSGQAKSTPPSKRVLTGILNTKSAISETAIKTKQIPKVLEETTEFLFGFATELWLV